MSVTVDDRVLPADELKFDTVGQLLAHIQQNCNRLVVQVLIDGEQPDLTQMNAIRQSPIRGHTLYIETAEPRQLALEVLQTVQSQLNQADSLRSGAVELLRTGETVKAMEKLRGCFSIWTSAEESIRKVATLLRIDLTRILAEGRKFADVLDEFAAQLRLIKKSLENRDYVALIDTLEYETADMGTLWSSAIQSMRSALG